MQLLSNEHYHSRRSPVTAHRGMVASSQPLANAAGVRVLEAGGTAADAAVAVAAALQVTQPCSTGLGGDAFWLYHDAENGLIHAANGSGRSPNELTLEAARTAAGGRTERPLRLPPYHAHCVTVPGAPAAWQDLLDRFGSLPRADVIAPAIALAEGGFPVGPLTAGWWTEHAAQQLATQPHGHELMILEPQPHQGRNAPAAARGPRPGERMRLPTLAWSLQQFADLGADPFYRGEIAVRIVAAVRAAGGLLSADDLAAHETAFVEPLTIQYGGAMVWECPPNGHGLAALIALGILREYETGPGRVAAAGAGEPASAGFTPSASQYHRMIEAMRFGFLAAAEYVADPDTAPAPVSALLSTGELAARATCITEDARIADLPTPAPHNAGSDTVYFCTADRFGNLCSFINSNYMGFGTGIVPEGCGFSLQNRGHGFVLAENHPNALAPRKRPYHTIIPGMITGADGSVTAFGVMGGMMQPQGHLQTAVALLNDGLDPQAALDRPRFQLADGDPNGQVLLEDSVPDATAELLRTKGHRVRFVGGSERAIFGLGAIIRRDPDGTLWGASDPRGDGAAAGAL